MKMALEGHLTVFNILDVGHITHEVADSNPIQVLDSCNVFLQEIFITFALSSISAMR